MVSPKEAAFSVFRLSMLCLVFSAINLFVSSEWFLPMFHGTFPLFAADIFALLASVCALLLFYEKIIYYSISYLFYDLLNCKIISNRIIVTLCFYY
jgi:hypothetical protein